MPTLKQLVDGAIKAGSKFAFPDAAKEISITVSKRDEWGSQFTAPANGIVQVTANGSGALGLQGYKTHDFLWVRGTGLTALAGSVQVTKGSGVVIFVSSTIDTVKALFVPAAGSS